MELTLEAFDTSLRMMLIGQILLIIIVLLVRGPKKLSIPTILLLISVIAYLLKSSPALSASMSFAFFPLWILTVASAYFVWLCAATLFEFERPPLWAAIVFPALSLNCVAFPLLTGSSHPAPELVGEIASLIVVLHALYLVHRGGLDDLLEPRRRFRLCFIGCIALTAAYIMVLNIVYFGRVMPSWIPVTNSLLIMAVVLATSVPILTRPEDLLPEPTPPNLPPERSPELSPSERRTELALTRAMADRAYARTGLTIRQLATELKTPEHQLRVLINQRLGYKNFSTFLNGHRITETCQRLADQEQDRTPILTIALDAGFASLAPFNRAFKLQMGMTPSEYRRQESRSDPNNVTVLRR